MNAVERLLHSSRPQLAPCRDHQDQLRRRLQQRAEQNGGTGGFPSRHPDLVVLALSAAAALALLLFSLTAETPSSRLRPFDATGLDATLRPIARIAAPRLPALGTYARMLVPRTQRADNVAALQQALGQALRDRQSALRFTEGR